MRLVRRDGTGDRENSVCRKESAIAEWLKHGLDEAERREIDARVRKAVEDAIKDIEARAVREMCVKFDGWDRKWEETRKSR